MAKMVKEFDLNDSDSYIERTDTKCETLPPFDLHIRSKWQGSMDKGHFRYNYFQIIYILISQVYLFQVRILQARVQKS